MTKTFIKEFFISIQGEGTYVGYKQLFIRFCKCNLNCKYCDTEFLATTGAKEYTPQELFVAISKLDLKNIHSISLTGGEPLLDIDFLKEFLPLACKLGKIYLETNATLVENFKLLKPFIDIVSADIKLQSATGLNELQSSHFKFFKLCNDIETYAKIVFDDLISDIEIEQTANLAKTFGLELVLSPMMIGTKPSVNSTFINKVHNKYLKYYDKVRVIPQTHKFLGIE